MQHHQPIRRKQAIARAHDSLVPAAQVPAPSVNPSPALATEQGSPVGHNVGNISIHAPGGEIGPEGGATITGRAPLAVQRDALGLPPVPDVALTPPSLLQPPAPAFAPAPDPSLQVHLDPQAEVAVQQVDQALAPTNVKSALVNLRLGSATTPPPPADPLTSPAPTPPAAAPAVPAGAGPATAHEAGAGDLMDAVMAVPAVDASITDLRMRATDRVRADWGHLPTGERAVTISAVAVIGAGVLAGAVSDPDARQILLTQLNGKVLPVPGVDWLHVEIGTRPDNLMLGLHVDVGALLPSSLGFGSSSPSAIGGPPPTADPFTPTQRSVQRSLDDDRLPGVAPQGNRALSAAAPSRAGFDLGAIAIYPPAVQRADAGTGSAAGGGSADDDLARRIQAASATGTAIDGAVQRRLEGGLGADLSGVRVHTGGEADSLARSVNAVAFTTGPDIFFRAGAYQPQSSEGMHLLAHEAAHTVQQAAGPVAGTPAPGGVSISDPADSDEQAAGREANAVVMGGETAAIQRSPEGGAIAPAYVGQPQPGYALRADGQRSLAVQRGPKEDIAALQHDMAVGKKRTAANTLELSWTSNFRERYLSYQRAILRVTQGLDKAAQNFTAAQSEQAALDQVWAQILLSGLTVILSIKMEWIGKTAGGMLGKVDAEVDKALKDFVEAFENPGNAVVAGAANTTAAAIGLKNVTSAAMPNLSGGAIGFFTSNQDFVLARMQNVEKEFQAHHKKMDAATDEEWLKFEPAAQAARYQAAYDQLQSNVGGEEDMKPADEVAKIFERHLWAQWILNQREGEVTLNQHILEEASMQAGSYDKNAHQEAEQMDPAFRIGSYIEDALNAAGVSADAGVTLTGHWYSKNSVDAQRKLAAWARTYKTKGTIAK